MAIAPIVLLVAIRWLQCKNNVKLQNKKMYDNLWKCTDSWHISTVIDKYIDWACKASGWKTVIKAFAFSRAVLKQLVYFIDL